MKKRFTFLWFFIFSLCWQNINAQDQFTRKINGRNVVFQAIQNQKSIPSFKSEELNGECYFVLLLNDIASPKAKKDLKKDGIILHRS